MELFLTSQANVVMDDICKRLPKDAGEYRVLFIPTASDVYENPVWMTSDSDKLAALAQASADSYLSTKPPPGNPARSFPQQRRTVSVFR